MEFQVIKHYNVSKLLLRNGMTVRQSDILHSSQIAIYLLGHESRDRHLFYSWWLKMQVQICKESWFHFTLAVVRKWVYSDSETMQKQVNVFAA